ncbi:MAG: hypothetical protein Q9167_000485 [Letrouitia subvulpina]
MSNQDQSPFGTVIFEILAGFSRKSFFAHAAVLAKSERIQKQIEGNWKDTLQHKLVWDNWSEDIVNIFLEWLYTGDYKCPFPVGISPSSQSSEESHAEDQDISTDQEVNQELYAEETLPEPPLEPSLEPFDPVEEAKCAEPKPPDRPLTPLSDLTWSGDRSIQTTSQAEEFKLWSGFSIWKPTMLDYEDTLMTHAKLYVMADYFLLSELQNLTLHRLRSSLLTLEPLIPESQQMSNVVHLIDYVYEHTVEPIIGENPMRRLVSQYAALQFTNFKGDGIRQLLAKGGDFVPDLMEKYVRRVTCGIISTPSKEKSKKSKKKGLW